MRFLGHSTFQLTDGDVSILIDPFFTDNPQGATSATDVPASAILLTHGHADHLGDTVSIAKRTGAPVVAIAEIAEELADEGLATFDPNIGGTVTFAWGWVRLVAASHSSTTPKGTAGTPAGLVVRLGEKIIYHLGDTALFGDLALVGRRDAVDVALVCIGGHYTMDRHDAVEAVKLVGPRMVVPCHYDSYPEIETDVDAFKAEVEAETTATVAVLAPGESLAV